MPSLPPPPTIQPAPAPALSQAQASRPVRTNRADGPESSSFESALHQAGESIEQRDAAEGTRDDTEITVDEPIDPALNEVEIEAEEPEDSESPELELAPEDPTTSAAPEPTVAAVVGESIPQPEAESRAASPRDVAQSTEAQSKVVPGPAPKINAAGTPKTTAEAPQDPGLTPEEQQPESVASKAPTEHQTAHTPQTAIQSAVADSQETAATTPAPQSPNSAEPAPAPAAAAQAPIEVEAGAGEGASQDDSGRGAAQKRPDPSARVIESAPQESGIDSSEAQPLRQPVSESAPASVEPAAVEPQHSPSGLNPQGIRPGAAASAPQGPSLGTVEPDQAFTAGVQRGLAAAVRQQGGTLTIKLDPPSLGKLTIRMTIDQGRVEASFDANNAQARDLLIEHTSTLRASLRDKGLSVEKIEIIGASAAQSARAAQSSNGNQQGAHSGHDGTQHDAAGGQSRGRSETGEEESSRNDGVYGESARSAEDPSTSRFETELRYSVSAIA